MLLSLVRAILVRVVPFLEVRWPVARLYTLHDWHAHDGYRTDAAVTSWRELLIALASEEGLRELCSNDTRVHTAVFPDDCGFYLRFGLVDEWDRPPSAGDVAWGNVDLSGSAPLIEDIGSLLHGIARPDLAIQQAKGFFDRTYAG